MGALGTALLAAAAALVTSLGMGGGAVLLLYLTAVKGMDQLEAQGLNLLFFIPVAVVSLWISAGSGWCCWAGCRGCSPGCGWRNFWAGTCCAAVLPYYFSSSV